MRKLILVASLIMLQAAPALAEEPMQLSDAQWATRAYVPQPVAQPMPVQRVAPAAAPSTATPSPDITNSWDVMQFNFGM